MIVLWNGLDIDIDRCLSLDIKLSPILLLLVKICLYCRDMLNDDRFILFVSSTCQTVKEKLN